MASPYKNLRLPSQQAGEAEDKQRCANAPKTRPNGYLPATSTKAVRLGT